MSHLTPLLPKTARLDRMLLAVLLVGLLVRGTILWQYRDTLTRDDDNYGEIATNLRQHLVFGLGQQPVTPTAFRPPLYPLLLAGTMMTERITPLQVGVLHLLLGLLTILLVYQLARQYRLPRAAPLAALLVAIDPILLYQSTRIMTETLATLLAVAALYCLSRLNQQRHWTTALGSGCVLGLSILCRPTFLVWLILCLLAVVALEPKWRKRWQLGGALLGGAVLIVAPWTIRNMVQFNRPIALTTHGGYTLLLGNNPVFYQHLQQQPWGSVWQSKEVDRFKQGLEKMRPDGDPTRDYWSPSALPEPADTRSTTEYERDRFSYRVARHQISQQPKMFLLASLVKVGRLWSPLPHQIDPAESNRGRWVRYLIASWYAASYLLALVGLYRLRGQILRRPWLWGLLLVITLTAVHTLFWSNIRMRAPLVPWIALLVAAACCGEAAEARQPGASEASTDTPKTDLKS